MASESLVISKSNSGLTCSADVTLGSGAAVEVGAGVDSRTAVDVAACVDSDEVFGSDVESTSLHAPNRTTLAISDAHAVLID